MSLTTIGEKLYIENAVDKKPFRCVQCETRIETFDELRQHYINTHYYTYGIQDGIFTHEEFFKKYNRQSTFSKAALKYYITIVHQINKSFQGLMRKKD